MNKFSSIIALKHKTEKEELREKEQELEEEMIVMKRLLKQKKKEKKATALLLQKQEKNHKKDMKKAIESERTTFTALLKGQEQRHAAETKVQHCTVFVVLSLCQQTICIKLMFLILNSPDYQEESKK